MTNSTSLIKNIVTQKKYKNQMHWTDYFPYFYLFLGVLIVYILQSKIDLKKLKYFILVFMTLFIFSPFAYSYISITKKDQRTDYPGKLIAEKIQYEWSKDHNEAINVVLGNEWNAGNLSYHLKSRPVWEGEVNKDKLDKLLKFTCINDICVGIK